MEGARRATTDLERSTSNSLYTNSVLGRTVDVTNAGVAVARLPVRVLIVAFAVFIPLVAVPAVATVSGENGLIVFVADLDDGSDIYTMRPDGSGTHRITDAPDQGGFPVRDDDPSWSPDGRQVTFTRTTTTLEGSEAVETSSIWTMNADGSNQKMVATGYDPSWSPDGGAIAFTMSAIGATNGLPTTVVAILRLSGDVTVLTDPGDWLSMGGHSTSADDAPVWDPRGAEILFLRHFTPATPISTYTDLMAVDPISGHVRLLTPTGDSFGMWANRIGVAPDMASVLASSWRTLPVDPKLYLYDLDQSNGEVIGLPGGYGIGPGATFAPNGGSIAATLVQVANPAAGYTLWTMGPDGSDAVKIGKGWSPDWQPVNPYPFGLVDPSQGEWHLRHVDGRVESFYFGNPGDVPFMGDWNCDGIDTPGLYRQSDGYVYLRNRNTQGTADVKFFFGNPGDMPIAGDFNNNGCDTVSVYRPSNQTFYIINELGSGDKGLGAADLAFRFGNPGDKPFIGDFNGDGTDTVGLHRESTGLVYYRNTHTTGIADASFLFGNPGDRLVANDWSSDGVDSPGLFRPMSSTAFLRFTNSEGNADARFMFGEPYWLPVTGTFELP